MKVGRSSYSNISVMPIWLKSFDESKPPLVSGVSDLVPVYLSTDCRLLGAGLTSGGLPVNDPRANVTVLIPKSSERVLLNILAAASELENRGGNSGRAFEGVLEKKSGEGGVVVLIDGPVKLKECSLCAGCLYSLGFLWVGVTVCGARNTPVESSERLIP